ncbi:Signal peptidase I (SPase I) transmembrane protein [gamma proteobacterium HdN1]|nr:Signal peptidase I (SPase I) transmembrane protein [gamma proteobacterium HdN1]
MDIDFTFWLVVLVGVTGFVSLLDLAYFGPRRNAAAARYQQQAGDKVEPAMVETLKREPEWIEYPKAFFPVLAVVLILRSFLVEPFKIPSGSMLPTLEIGDYILVNKFAYGLRLPVLGTEVVQIGKPARGDVLVFRYPENPNINFIKRVVGVPGDKVRYEDKRLYINGELVEQRLDAQFPPSQPRVAIYNETLGNFHHETQVELHRNFQPPQEWDVPADSYLVFGDNRDNSRDSRFWGYVPDKLIVGKAFAIWMHMPSWVPSFSRNRLLTKDLDAD